MKKNFLYSLYITLFVVVLFLVVSLPILKDILLSLELKSYDLRHNIHTKQKLTNPEIVVLAIDDNSLELLADKYGSWPWDRQAYVDAISYLNQSGAKQVILDLMFVNHSKNKSSDDKLIKIIKENDNIFVAMNLDNREESIHDTLPGHLEAKVKNKGTVEFPSYKNYRPIMSEITNGTPNVGMINCNRDFDGISRGTPSFLKMNGKHYPYLGLMAAAKHFDIKDFEINENNELLLKDKKLPLQKNGYMLLNWYTNEFKTIPFWKMKKNPDAFKNKIVFLGVTAASMYDIKSTPVNSNMAGIELQSTLFNNFLDNSLIKKSPDFITLLTAIVLAIIVGLFTLNSPTAFASLSLCLGLLASYWIASLFILDYANLWVDTTFVNLAVILTFVISYTVKYKNKSKDFEYTYKLATTDSMTGLYNHRFFQEQMVFQIENAKRYDANFSLVLIDIDFFKKFNDNYGHQAGDAVLKQVAELLKKSVRVSDIVARYGGEEMAIILPNNDFEHALAAAEKICTKVSQTPFHLNPKLTKNVTISLGVATFPEHGQTPAELIEHADKGLYKAKENGRNQVGKV